jgi:hypothetical protein
LYLLIHALQLSLAAEVNKHVSGCHQLLNMDESFCGSPLWTLNTTTYVEEESENGTTTLRLHEPVPDFTPCFHNTVLVWIPCGFLLFVAPFYIYFLLGLKQRGTITWLNVTKTVFSSLLVILCLVDLIHRLRTNMVGVSPWPANLLAGFLQVIAMMLSIALIQLGRLRGVRSTGVLFLYWLLQLISASLILQSHSRSLGVHADGHAVYRVAYWSVFAVLVLIQLILASLVDHFADQQELDPHACPEGTASFLSIITFWWFTRLVVLGYQRPLTQADLWGLNPEDTSREVSPPFERRWLKELNKCRRYSLRLG